ncbi:30S ribosomal protein S7 [bacterium]|nr:30S ribosomal protein S7 [bacterium]|tara:strand:+ start:1197 stop:1646 length:450 start_codon:yes stop_codon:yes gene_type:complete
MNKVKFVAKGNTDLIEKFINYLMHQGKKTVARTVLNDCFAIIEKKTGKKGKEVFSEALENVKPSLEVRAKRIGGSVYQIPMEVKPFRQFQLASRWILAAARGKKGAPMADRLANELIQASNNEGTSVKKKEDSHRMAQANKAFAHFAKY